MRPLDLILRLSGLTIFLVIGVVFIHRKLLGQFVFFSAYIAFSPVATILRFLLREQTVPYFWLYWGTEAAYSILELLVLNEVFRRLYELEYEDHAWFKFLIPATAAIILAISLWGAFHNPPGSDPVPLIVSGIFWFDVGVHWLEAGILLLLVVLALFFTLPTSRYDFGILAGFTVSACVTLVADLTRSQLGRSYEAWFQYGPPIGYLFASLIWLYGFWRPPAPPAALDVKQLAPLDDFPNRHEGMMKIVEA